MPTTTRYSPHITWRIINEAMAKLNSENNEVKCRLLNISHYNETIRQNNNLSVLGFEFRAHFSGISTVLIKNSQMEETNTFMKDKHSFKEVVSIAYCYVFLSREHL